MCKCKIKNNVDICYHLLNLNFISGKCHCLPGWMGMYCNIPCPARMFGADCTQHCRCANSAVCSPIDGECQCTRGWRGKFCTNKCTYGYFGDHCATPCECKSENFVCDHLNGCTCPQNFTGELCDVSIFDKYEPSEFVETDESSEIALAISLSVITLILILTIIALGLLYYRRMKRNTDTHLEVRYVSNSFDKSKSLEM